MSRKVVLPERLAAFAIEALSSGCVVHVDKYGNVKARYPSNSVQLVASALVKPAIQDHEVKVIYLDGRPGITSALKDFSFIAKEKTAPKGRLFCS